MKKIWSKTLRPGEKWSGNIGRGKYIHFKALGDDANVSMLMYNMLDTSERYNMPDTLKAQFISSLTKGNVLMSDNGRVLASIVEDRLQMMQTGLAFLCVECGFGYQMVVFSFLSGKLH